MKKIVAAALAAFTAVMLALTFIPKTPAAPEPEPSKPSETALPAPKPQQQNAESFNAVVSDRYYFSLQNGLLTVKAGGANGETVKKSEIDLSVLPEAERARLSEGFYVTGRENMLSSFENLIS